MTNLQTVRQGKSIFNLLLLTLISFFIIMLIIQQQHPKSVEGFIKFGYILNTTACDTCDELRTYSGRNVFCCLAQSKCCG